MDEYSITKLNIYEAYESGYITESEKYDLLEILEAEEDHYDHMQKKNHMLNILIKMKKIYLIRNIKMKNQLNELTRFINIRKVMLFINQDSKKNRLGI